MENKILLTFPGERARSLDRSKLSQIAFELGGFAYGSPERSEPYTGVVHYTPQRDLGGYRNAFKPEITVTEILSPTGLCLSVEGRLLKSVRVFSRLYCGFAALMQCAILMEWVVRDHARGGSWAMLIPCLLVTVFLLLSALILRLETKVVAGEYKRIIEALIANEVMSDKRRDGLVPEEGHSWFAP